MKQLRYDIAVIGEFFFTSFGTILDWIIAQESLKNNNKKNKLFFRISDRDNWCDQLKLIKSDEEINIHSKFSRYCELTQGSV